MQNLLQTIRSLSKSPMTMTMTDSQAGTVAKTPPRKLLILPHAQRVASLVPHRSQESEPELAQSYLEPKIQCSICCRPVSGTKFLIGKEEDPNKQSHGFVGHMPLYSFEFSPTTWNWKFDSGAHASGLFSGVYHLGTQSGEPTFVLCYDCFQIVPRFMAHRVLNCQSGRESYLRSPEELYVKLKQQFLLDPVGQGHDLKLYWPRNAFADEDPTWIFRIAQRRWICEQSWLESSSSQPIPSLPLYILSKLKPLPEDSMTRVSFSSKHSPGESLAAQRSKLLELPVELIQQIADFTDLASVFDMRETCHRIAQCIELDQRFWYTRLMRKELLGFLFKHDSQDVIGEIHRRALKRGLLPHKMDWMQLIKSLSQFSSFTATGCFVDAPPGFRNRRRVWKILETMEQTPITI